MTEVPAYLTQIKRDIEEEYDYIRRLQDEEEEEIRNSQVLLGTSKAREWCVVLPEDFSDLAAVLR